MTKAVSINTFLADGDPEGVVFTQMSNWTGQAIKIPRKLFLESANIAELRGPGLYLLFGQQTDNPNDKLAYVGETNSLTKRISQHLYDTDKSFFETIICFCSKDENLTVSHTKYLEQKLIELLSQSSRLRLVNCSEGSTPNLPRMMKAEMDAYFDNMKIILPTLGYPFLYAYAQTPRGNKKKPATVYYLKIGTCKATAVLTSNGIEIKKGSEMKTEEAHSLSKGCTRIRKMLIRKNIVSRKGRKYIFNVRYEFASPSAAAAIVLGYPINGRTTWKDKQGKSIKEIEEERRDQKRLKSK
jgi:hypothetical protein